MSRILVKTNRILSLTPSCCSCSSLIVIPSRNKTHKPIPEFDKPTYVYKNLPDREKNPEFEENEYLPRRISYWPPDLGQYRRRSTAPKPWDIIQSYIKLDPVEIPNKPEWVETPEYPEITDYVAGDQNSLEMARRREWYDKIRSLPSVDQKMMEIADNNRLMSIRIQAWTHLFDNLNVYQNLTKTCLLSGLPPEYDSISVPPELKSRVTPFVLDAVASASSLCNQTDVGRYRSQHKFAIKSIEAEVFQKETTVFDAVNIALKAVTPVSDHLVSAQVDINPEIRSYWYVGGLEWPSTAPRFSLHKRFFKESNQSILFTDHSVMNIRTSLPLKPSVDALGEESAKCREVTYEESKRNPARMGYPLKWSRFANLAGYWYDPNETCDFPFLSVYSRDALKLRDWCAQDILPDSDKAVDGIGIMLNFAWLHSLAFYHGFSPYDEITYPFTTQSIVTDGKTWNFYVYQLNSHCFHGDLQFNRSNKIQNLCWSSGPMKLFENVDENGSVSGLNDEVIDLLLKFLLRKPSPVPDNVALRPYIGVDSRTEEQKQTDAVKLRRLFAQQQGYREKQYLSAARVNPWHRVYGYYNPDAPPINMWRLEPRDIRKNFRLDRHKFTI